MTRRGHLFFDVVKDGVCLFEFLLRFGLHHLAQPKAHTIEDLRHGRRRGQVVRALTLLSEGVQGGLSREPRVSEARAKRRVLLRMRLGELTQRLSRLRIQLFPAFAPTESRLRPQTDDPGLSLGQAKRHGLAPPTQDGFSHQGVALTIFHRHLGLKGAPFGAGHFGCR